MGTEAESRLNYMVMIDFNFAVRMEGINVNYVLDAEDEDVTNDIRKKIEECFDYPASVLINIGNKNKTSLLEKFFSSNHNDEYNVCYGFNQFFVSSCFSYTYMVKSQTDVVLCMFYCN